jgi:Putative prokaryotic signal transducing protein
MGHDGYTKVATFSDRTRAEMMRELLEGAEISAILRVDDGGGFQPQLAYGLGVILEVREEQKAAATELLREFGGLDDAEGED